MKYDLGDASIITKTIIDVPFLSSVEENTIYDINHEVTFNGEGTLNGIAINSGYVITEAGNYTLVVKGKSTDIKVVNFTIEKLCIDIDKEPNELKDMNVNKETISINQLDKRKLINYGNLSYQEVVNNDSDKYFIYLVTFAIGALLGLSFSIFNLFKLRKKTNK